jgi:glutamate synthase (NADPH/NADH) small chain
MKEEGIMFRPNMEAGKDIMTQDLLKQYDAILLATGAGAPRDLVTEGRNLKGVHFALDFLTQSNKFIDGQFFETDINAKDKTVVVIGGGDTGSDCVGTSNRQGAIKVYQFEILPKPMEWDKPYNPSWPAWPQYLRTSSSHQHQEP